MSALTQELKVARAMTLPLSSFEDHLFQWRNEIEFLEREKDFFLYLLKQSKDYSSLNGGAKVKVMADRIEKFSQQKLEPFKRKLNHHTELCQADTEGKTKSMKMHQIMSKQFHSIQKSFRTFKETTFENVEDLVNLTII